MDFNCSLDRGGRNQELGRWRFCIANVIFCFFCLWPRRHSKIATRYVFSRAIFFRLSLSLFQYPLRLAFELKCSVVLLFTELEPESLWKIAFSSRPDRTWWSWKFFPCRCNFLYSSHPVKTLCRQIWWFSLWIWQTIWQPVGFAE